jgi:hypothetical protein
VIATNYSCRICADGTGMAIRFVIGAYPQLFETKKSFQMRKVTLASIFRDLGLVA